jgi:hypothetical protein
VITRRPPTSPHGDHSCRCPTVCLRARAGFPTCRLSGWPVKPAPGLKIAPFSCSVVAAAMSTTSGTKHPTSRVPPSLQYPFQDKEERLQ